MAGCNGGCVLLQRGICGGSSRKISCSSRQSVRHRHVCIPTSPTANCQTGSYMTLKHKTWHYRIMHLNLLTEGRMKDNRNRRKMKNEKRKMEKKNEPGAHMDGIVLLLQVGQAVLAAPDFVRQLLLLVCETLQHRAIAFSQNAAFSQISRWLAQCCSG